MSDTKSWNNSFNYLKDKTVNPVRACATYEQIEAQNRKNEQRYGRSSLRVKDKGVDIAEANAMARLKEEYMSTEKKKMPLRWG